MTFASWWERGFHDLIPIIPPNAELASYSMVRPADRGKVPGVKTKKDRWVGLQSWNSVTPSREWGTWGANIGLRTKNFPAVDIDCTDPDLVVTAREIAKTIFGDAPLRFRENSSRCTLVYRTETPMKRARLFLVKDGENHLVEVLGDGQQFVIEGTHPSGTAWVWNREFTNLDLAVITPDQVTQYFEVLAAAAVKLGFEPSATGRATTTSAAPEVQGALAGDLETLVTAVGHIPNDSPDRADYIRMGAAIKAALPDEPEQAFRLWWSWCQRWEPASGERNTLERAQADWAGMKPPYAIGASWLLDKARDSGYATAQDEFGDIAEDEPPEPGDVPYSATTPEGERIRSKTTDQSGSVAYSDAWHANQLVLALENRIRYCERLNGWLLWDGHRWAQDETREIENAAGIIARKAGREALRSMKNATEARKVAHNCASVACRRNLLVYASTDRRVATPVDDFDADPWALNTPKGVLNLRTGVLDAPNPDRLFTRCTAVAPKDVPTPLWAAFLAETTRQDGSLQDYLQTLAGYALTGSTQEHMLAFLWGPGGNGKGVFLNTLVRVFGSYATVAAMDTFTASRSDRHPTELAALFGARLVTAQETQEGRSWDEARVKSITGGDPITARYMRENFFTYIPQFKLLFAGNHRPRINNLDDAMKRRLHLVPFTNKPKVVNLNLPQQLEPEWPGILHWAIEGCLRWQRDGLVQPEIVAEATADYFLGEDAFGRWVAENTIAGGETQAKDGYADWQIWCHQQHERSGSYRGFLQNLARHRIDVTEEEHRSVIHGITLRRGEEFGETARGTL